MKYLQLILIVLLAVVSGAGVAAQDDASCDLASVAAVLESIDTQLASAEELEDIDAARLALSDLRTNCFDEETLNAGITDVEWTEYAVDGLQISVPTSWIDASDPAFVESSLDVLGNLNPQAQSFLESNRQQLATGAFELIMMELSTNSSLVVVSQDIGMSINPAFIEPLVVAQMESLGFEVVETDVIILDVGEVFYIKVKFAPEAMLGLEFPEEGYIFSISNQMYSVNLGTITNNVERMRPIFDEILNSIVATTH